MTDKSRLRVLIATPYGLNGRGGIDRLNDMIFDAVANYSSQNVSLSRLVTRGKRGLIHAQFIFFFAIIKFIFLVGLSRVDVLHIYLSNRGSCYRKILLGKLARHFGIPYVIHLHGSNFDEYWSATSGFLYKAIEQLFSNSAHFIAAGEFWAKAIEQRVPGLTARTTILPNATPKRQLDHQPSLDGRVRITFLGQLGPRKGTPQLLLALSQLRHRSDWRATIAGDGEIAETKASAYKLDIGDKVTVPGWLDTSESHNVLSNSDILVLPSFSENLPMVILEGLAYGIPVVSTPVGAIQEVIKHERNGLIVPVGDIQALADALSRLIDDSKLRFCLGEQGQRDHQESYEIGPYIERLSEVWLRVRTNRLASDFGRESNAIRTIQSDHPETRKTK